MKKNISILFVVMIFVSLFLAACGGTTKPAVGSTNNDLIGTWTNDASTVTWTFTADGKLSSSDGQAGMYTFDGSKITVTASDGNITNWSVVITGDKMVQTSANGAVFNYTKSK